MSTLATKFDWDEAIAEREVKMMDAGKITAKLPAFAAQLEQRHSPGDWKDVLAKTRDLLLTMGKDNPLKPEDYRRILQPVLLMVGDRDKMVSLEETVTAFRSLPAAQMAVLPATPDPIEQADPEMLAWQLGRCINTVSISVS
ncbi:MAG: hypothetical protein ABIX01_01155 [Chitinophagaceae bacterium]